MFVIIIRFPYIYSSQHSVKTHLWCGGIYNNQYCKLFADCASEKIFKIGQ